MGRHVRGRDEQLIKPYRHHNEAAFTNKKITPKPKVLFERKSWYLQGSLSLVKTVHEDIKMGVGQRRLGDGPDPRRAIPEAVGARPGFQRLSLVHTQAQTTWFFSGCRHLQGLHGPLRVWWDDYIRNLRPLHPRCYAVFLNQPLNVFLKCTLNIYPIWNENVWFCGKGINL